MHTINVYCDSPILTEEEFFKREFGLNLIYNAGPRELLNQVKSTGIGIVASAKPLKWKETLKIIPPSTVIFFLLGNETYEPLIFNSLNDLPSLKHVFIYNPPTEIQPIHHIYSLIGDLRDEFPNLFPRNIFQILRDSRTSSHLRNKFKETQLRYHWSPFPQGYSNSFVHGLQAIKVLSLNSNHSLINPCFTSDLQTTTKKEKRFFFVGQETNRRRQQIISFMNKRSDVTIISKDTGFGGTTFDGDQRYAELLLSSWFNLIPPGFFNNSNHRYTESCIVGAIPVILFQNSIDHSNNENWTKKLTHWQSYSFKNLVSFLNKLDEARLVDLARQIAAEDLEIIRNARIKIDQILKS